MSTIIDFSPIESDILRLKVGRCNNDSLDESTLYRQIVDEGYDLCRVKVPAEDEMASFRLNKMGLPYFFSGSIRRYKTKISAPPPGNYNFPELQFEIYDGSQDTLLKEMLVGTWGAYPIGYYRTPYLQDFVSKEKEIECVFQYYKKYNLNKDYPNNSIVFIKHDTTYVGFFALNIVNNNLESHIGGILEPYRKSGFFLDKLRYIKEFCIKNQLEHFIFGARNENAEVQKIFQYVGFQAVGSDNVFHIPSLLSISQREPVEMEIKIIAEDTRQLYQELLGHSLSVAGKILRDNNFSFHLNHAVSRCHGQNIKIKFSFPIDNEEGSVIVLRVETAEDMPLIGYLKTY